MKTKIRLRQAGIFIDKVVDFGIYPSKPSWLLVAIW
jgi:hypothetical protein